MRSDCAVPARAAEHEQVSALIAELARAGRWPRRAGLVVVAGGPTGTVAALGRAVEEAVFGAEFGNSPEELAREYEPYESASSFLVVVDVRAGRPVGVIRTIVPGPAGLKSVDDLAGPTGLSRADFLDRAGLASLDDCLDVATLAVHPAYRGRARGHRVSLLLFRALDLSTRALPLLQMVAVMDTRALRSLRFVGLPVRPVPGATGFPYLGSPASDAIVIVGAESGPALERRAAELSALARPRVSDLLAPRALLERVLAARAVARLVTGRALDRAIVLDEPGTGRPTVRGRRAG